MLSAYICEVKNQKQFLFSFLLLQVLLLTPEAGAFAFSSPDLDLGSLQGDYFKTHQNRKAFLTEGNIAEITFQNQFENENKTGSFSPATCRFKKFSFVLLQPPGGSEIVTDRKKILKSQIFPFHFFW